MRPSLHTCWESKIYLHYLCRKSRKELTNFCIRNTPYILGFCKVLFLFHVCLKVHLNGSFLLFWSTAHQSKSYHPVYFKKTSAAPFGNRGHQLRGAWVCAWADLPNLQGGSAPPHQTGTRWTEKEQFLCLSIFLESCVQNYWK